MWREPPGSDDRTEVATQGAGEFADPLVRVRTALDQGDAQRGRRLFHTTKKIVCRACHVIDNTGGGFVGPDLSAIGSRATAEDLLESLTDPNATIVDGYQTFVLWLESGQLLSGIIVSEDQERVVIAPPSGGTVTVDAKSVQERIVSQVSTMPPVGDLFRPTEIADLVAYLLSNKADACTTNLHR